MRLSIDRVRRLVRLDLEPGPRSLADLEPSRWPRVWAVGGKCAVAAALVGVGVLVGAHMTHRKMLRADRDAAQAAKDVAYADSLTAECMAKDTAARLLGASERAAGEVRRAHAVTAGLLDGRPRGQTVVAGR